MKRTTKVLAIIITLIMITSVVTPFASAKSITGADTSAKDNLSQTQKGGRPLTTAKELLKIQNDNEVPEDYHEDGPCMSGIELDEPVQAVTKDELLTVTDEVGEQGNSTLKLYDSINDKNVGTCTPYDFQDDYVWCQNVAFDPTHSCSKNYVAFFGLKVCEKDTHFYKLVLDIVDMNTKEVVATKTFFEEEERRFIFHNDINLLGTLYSIKTACFDNKYEDTLVLSYTKTNPSSGTVSYNFESKVEFYKLSDLSLELIKTLDMKDYLQNSIDIFNIDSTVAANSTYSYQISLGDFDRDYKDELAITSSLVASSGKEHNIDPSYYTTEIAIIDNPIDETPERVYDDFIMNQTRDDSDYNYYKMMCQTNCASGDIDGNKADELIIGGGTVEGAFHKNYDETEHSNPFYYDPVRDSSNKQGLVFVSFDGEKYVKSQIYEYDLPNAILQSFHLLDRYKFPLETAYMNGYNNSCSIFFNGYIFDFVESSLVKTHTYELFTKDKKEFIEDDSLTIAIEDVKAGNITDDPLGKESFAFSFYTYGVLPNTVERKYYFGAVYYQNDTITDNTNELKIDDSGKYVPEWSYVTPQSEDGTKSPVYSIIVGDVVANDGLKIKYIGTDFAYSDPQVAAVIQAAPYFKQLGDWNSFMGTTEYSIISSHADTNGGSTHSSVEAGIIAGASTGVKDVIEVEATLSVGYSNSNTSGWSEEFVASTTQSFTACDTDTIVIVRTPITIYKYRTWDNENECWAVDEKGNPMLTYSATKLSPTYYQMTFEEYNKYVDEYNKSVDEKYKNNTDPEDKPVYLKKIKEKPEQTDDYVNVIPTDTTGNPYKYRKSTSGLSTLYVSDKAHDLGISGGSQSEGHEKTKTSGKNNSFDRGLHVHEEITVSGSFTEFVSAKGGVYVDCAYTWEKSHGESDTNGIGGAGQVVDIAPKNYLEQNKDMLSNYHFRWKYAIWNTVLQDDTAIEEKDELQAPVLEYIVTDVVYPGQFPSNVKSKLSEDDRNIIISWNEPDISETPGAPELQKDTKYHIYREKADPQNPEVVEVGVVDYNTHEFMEPAILLQRGKIYNYYVGCEYEGVSKPYTSITIKPTVITRTSGGDYYLGDGNFNGKIDISDATVVQLILVKLLNDDDGHICQRININGDGANITNATIIQQFLAKIPTDYDKIIGTKQYYK